MSVEKGWTDPDDMPWWQFATSGPYYPLCEEERVEYHEPAPGSALAKLQAAVMFKEAASDNDGTAPASKAGSKDVEAITATSAAVQQGQPIPHVAVDIKKASPDAEQVAVQNAAPVAPAGAKASSTAGATPSGSPAVSGRISKWQLAGQNRWKPADGSAAEAGTAGPNDVQKDAEQQQGDAPQPPAPAAAGKADSDPSAAAADDTKGQQQDGQQQLAEGPKEADQGVTAAGGGEEAGRSSTLADEAPGVMMARKLRHIKNHNVVEYNELLPLPFEAPSLLSYIISQVIELAMVSQYVVTMLITLMTAMAEVNKFKDNTPRGSSELIYAILVTYPVTTLTLLLISFTEINIRKMMYYRMMTLGIVLDWRDSPLWSAWFTWYFILSWIVVNAWTIIAATVSTRDSGSPAFTCWVVVNMQTFLLFNFWRSRVMTGEEQLVTVSNFVERAPTAAKALIENVDVIRESDLAVEIMQVHKKLLKFKLATDDSDPDFSLFNLKALRKKRIQYGLKRRRSEHEDVSVTDLREQVQSKAGATSSYSQWFKALGDVLQQLLRKLLFEKLYGLIFTLLIIVRRVHSKRLSVWPFANDLPYFMAMFVLSTLGLLAVLGVEAYALWLTFGGNDGSVERLFGVNECRGCYSKLYKSGRSCEVGSFCNTEPAQSGLCLMHNLVSGVYNASPDAVVKMLCPARLNETLPLLY